METLKHNPRFGHSITSINDQFLLCFGGAIETGRGLYSTTNDSFLIDKNTLE